jgi:hypothetical protein
MISLDFTNLSSVKHRRPLNPGIPVGSEFIPKRMGAGQDNVNATMRLNKHMTFAWVEVICDFNGARIFLPLSIAMGTNEAVDATPQKYNMNRNILQNSDDGKFAGCNK